MTVAPADLRGLAAAAAGVLDDSVPFFVEQVGAARAVTKGVGDWATHADLELERRISGALTDRTGISVHGEEFGGTGKSVPAEGATWVLDPIDGTANYTARIPLTGISLALLAEGEPVVGLTWLPVLGERYVTVAGGPMERNGGAQPRLDGGRLADATVTLGTIGPKDAGSGVARYPVEYRLALVGALARRAMRVRMLGSSALELAWTAAGILDAALSFGNKPWDNAAGALLVRSAGGVVADLERGVYGLDSTSIVAARPGVADDLAALLVEMGDPASYR